MRRRLAAGILRLLKTPALRREMGDAGYVRVAERFGVNRLVEGLSLPPVYTRLTAREEPDGFTKARSLRKRTIARRITASARCVSAWQRSCLLTPRLSVGVLRHWRSVMFRSRLIIVALSVLPFAACGGSSYCRPLRLAACPHRYHQAVIRN